MIAQGGKTVFGATLGILMLQTRFPRIHGDIGNALSWPFPVQYRVVRGATPANVVLQPADPLLEAFIDAGRDLVETGCDGIATNCGFLSLLQDDLAAALGVPVASSSLMQVPLVRKMLPPDRRVGILTVSKETLTGRHLAAAGVPPGTPVAGTEGGREFTARILADAPEMDIGAARDDVVEAAAGLVRAHPDLGAIVLECTNMVPFAADVRRATGLPVFSIYSYLLWFQSALLPRRFDDTLDDSRG